MMKKSEVDIVKGQRNTIVGQLVLPTQGVTGGILIGGDVALYRLSDNILVIGADDILRIPGLRPLQFRDSGVFLNSDNDGHLDIDADISIDLNALAVVLLNTITGSLPAGPEGAIAYDATLNKLVVYTGAAWETVTSV